MFAQNTNAYKNIVSYETAFSNLNYNLEIVNLGSTAAYFDFDYPMMRRNGANFALPPQTLWYDFKILKKYSHFLKENAVVCICICPFSFLVENYDHDAYNLKYYGLLNTEDILKCSSTKKLLWKHIPLLIRPSLLKNIICDDPLELNTIQQTFVSENEDKTFARQLIQCWKKEFGWEKGYTLSSDQLLTMKRVHQILCHIVKYCKEQSFRPVLMILPMSQNLIDLIPAALLDNCLFAHIVQQKKEGVSIVNFMDMPDLCNYSNYYHALCLNDRGKRLFYQTLETIFMNLNLL